MKKENKMPYLVIICTFLGIAILGYTMRIIREKQGQEIIQNIGYAIGILDKVSAGGPVFPTVFFDFEENGNFHNHILNQGKDFVDFKLGIVGNRYLVIFNKNKPEDSRILFDHPISDSTDFKQYLEQYKTKPIDIKKYF